MALKEERNPWLFVAGLSLAFIFWRFDFGYFPILMALAGSVSAIHLGFRRQMQTAVQNVVLAILFFLVITPFGIVRRWLGASKIQFHKTKAPSYWLKKEAPVSSESLRRQF